VLVILNITSTGEAAINAKILRGNETLNFKVSLPLKIFVKPRSTINLPFVDVATAILTSNTAVHNHEYALQRRRSFSIIITMS